MEFGCVLSLSLSVYQWQSPHVATEHILILSQALLSQHDLQAVHDGGEAGPGRGLCCPARQHDVSVESLPTSQVPQLVRTAQSLPRQDLLFDLLVEL